MLKRLPHAQAKVVKKDLSTYEGNCFLGIDAGSTTTKIALVGEDGSLLYSFYHNNNGSTLHITLEALKDLFSKLPKKSTHCPFLLNRIRRGIGEGSTHA